jgi:putative ABC transport system substrate-binding protein
MRRREFISLLGGIAASSLLRPRAARAQQPAMPVIGFLGARGPDDSTYLLAAFRQGLNESGYIESQNVIVEYHWAEGHYDQLPALAVDLARRQVAVIFAGAPPAALAAKAATTAIPIVFVVGSDPVQSGLVASLARPGGNLTGTALLITALAAKRLQVLHELVPGITSIGILANPKSPNTDTDLKALQAAAASLGLEIHVSSATSEPEIATALGALFSRARERLSYCPMRSSTAVRSNWSISADEVIE